MEEAGYYAAIAVLIAFGLLAGNRWARSMGHAVLLGLAGTTIAVVTFLALIVGLAIFSPDGLNHREMGVRLGALLLFGSALGVVSAIGGRRRAEKASTRLF
jgi:Zn-dependent protease